MASCQMRGTPTLIVLDKLNRIRLNHFGSISDIQVGSLIGSLLAETVELSLTELKGDSTNHVIIEKCGMIAVQLKLFIKFQSSIGNVSKM